MNVKLNSNVQKKVIFIAIIVAAWSVAARSQSVDEMNKLRIAQVLEQAGEFGKAQDFYKQLHDSNPVNFVYFDGLRRCYINLKEYTLAEGLIRARIETDPADVMLYCELGDVFYKEGNADSASMAWNRAIEADPKNVGTYMAVADIMAKNRLFDKAIEVYRKGEDATNSKSGFIIQIARLYFYNLNYSESMRELLKLLQSDNKSSAMAYIQSQLGAYSSSSEAVDQFTSEMKKQVEDNPDDIYYRHLLAFLYMEQKDYPAAYKVYKWLDERSGAKGIELLSFAERAYNDEAYDAAAGAYREASRLSSAREVIAQSLMGYANSLRRLGEKVYEEDDRPCVTSDTLNILSSSLAAYGKVINGYPETRYLNPAILNSIDIEMNYFHDLKGAERLFSEHAEFSPEFVHDATLARIRLYIMGGRFNDALTEALGQLPTDTLGRKAAVADSYLDRIRFEAARSLYYMGNFDSAAVYLEQITSDPMSDAANEAIQLLNVISSNKAIPGALKDYAAAAAMEVQGRIPEAAAQLLEITNVHQQLPLADNARFDLAAAYCTMGKVGDALKYYSQLVADSTGIFADRAQLRIASIYRWTLHDTTRAIKEYESFLARFPNSIYQDRVRDILRNLLGNNS